MAIDIGKAILDILEADWNTANTDGTTPRFLKIVDKKRIMLRQSGESVIIIQRPRQVIEHAGTGPSHKNETDNINVDIRTFGTNDEPHFLNVIEEVKRIIDNNEANPIAAITETHILEFTGEGIDLSDGGQILWRKMMPIQLTRYNINR